MREIPLTKGKVALVDDEDYERLSLFKWHYAESDGIGYAKKNNKGKKPALIRMHRLVVGASEGQKVDHINRNTLDNRKSNLRFVTQSQNMMNATIRKTNRSGFKGVCFVSREKKWLATIWKDGKQTWLGYFKDKEDAAQAYNKAALELHGQYAFLNKI